MGWFLPAMAAISAGAAVYGATRKAPSAPGAPPLPELGPEEKKLQEALYARLTGGLRGEGLTPQISARGMAGEIAGIRKEQREIEYDLPGILGRLVPRADVDVRQFIKKSLTAQGARAIEGIKERYTGPMAKYQDVSEAQARAFDALSGEKRLGTSIAGMRNQAYLQQMYEPTFESELFGGLGGAAGTMLAGPIGYANMFNRLA